MIISGCGRFIKAFRPTHWEGSITIDRHASGLIYPCLNVGDLFTVDITDDHGVTKRHLDCPVTEVDEHQFTIKVPPYA